MVWNRLANLFTVSNHYSFGVDEVAVALVLPFLLVFGIGFVYQRAQSASNYSVLLLRSLFVFAPVASIITMMIGNNLARAVGIVGAMSVVRFRNALKSPLDAIFIFWALGVGIACGAGLYVVATLLVVLCGLFLLLVTVMDYGAPRELDSLLRVTLDPKEHPSVVGSVESMLRGASKRFQRVSSLSSTNSTARTCTFLVSLKRGLDGSAIAQDLKSLNGVLSVQFLGADSSVPV